MTPEQYIETEVLRSEAWYDQAAVRAKARFFRYRLISVVGAATIPVLANLPIETSIGTYPLKTLLITLISLAVVYAVGIENVRHFGDEYKNFRSAQTALLGERMQFAVQGGEYSKLDAPAAFRLFVERVEAIRRSETTATLSRMTSNGTTHQESDKAMKMPK